jgi:hypothetical protein
MSIKQLQNKAREEFDKMFGCEKEETFVRSTYVKNFQDTLIEQTYNKARKDLIEKDIKRLEEKEHFTGDENFDDGYFKALEEEINYKKKNENI